MDKARSETNIIILDACRDNPWGASWSRSGGLGGLAPVVAPRGTLIAYSTSPGEKSYDGLGPHGRYTEALLQHIDAVCPVETMFKRVRNTLAAVAIKKQVPWEHTSLIAEFFFNRSRNVPVTAYSDQATQDGSFLADPTKPAHSIIAGLRSHNWYQQNDATGVLTPAVVNSFTESECFLIGRGLYSAAVGDAKRAKFWTNTFAQCVTGMNEIKRKALLDGILFEIFFDREGKLRDAPKAKFLDQLYLLSKYPDCRPSFEFIADALVQTGKRFYAFPDLDSQVSVDVLTHLDPSINTPVITAVMIGGRNILTPENADVVDENGIPLYQRVSEETVRARLTQEAAIPMTRLNLMYPDLPSPPEQLRYPHGFSLEWAW
jgi:hypothetical protein